MTTLLAKLEHFLGHRVTLHSKPLPDPEPVFAPQPRPSVGLFAKLTPEQKSRALKYNGEVALHDC